MTLTLSGSFKTLGQIIGDHSGHLLFIMRCILLFFIILCSATTALADDDATAIPANIQKIFPSATRIGAEHTDIPVTPVYQLQKLLGYAFESRHFASFMGFTGKPVNMLIGLDEKGRFIDVIVLNHAEPIFIHGLGEQPMFDFIAQYKGRSVRERIIVGGNRVAGSDATYFDGVTKATVSVLVINDTIISSALKVARSKLDGFVALSNKIVNEDYFEALNFDELVERGYIIEHKVLANELSPLASEIQQAGKPHITEDGVFSHHYYMFLNIPVIGRNILGEEEYQRLLENLAPGEVAMGVLHQQGFSFISEEFIAQTNPENLRVKQGDFPLPARDVDFYSFYSPSFAVKMPEYIDVKVLRLKSQSGLDLSQNVTFSIALPYSPNFSARDEHLFTKQTSLSEDLFIENPASKLAKPIPLWQRIWGSKITDISIISLYLVLLTYFFIFQKRYVKYTKIVHYVRWGSLVFILFYIGFYAQGQLSVVNIYTLFLAIWEGFQIQVFLLDPVIFILWVFVFVTLFLFGRGLFCGWLCPFGALQEMMGVVAEKFRIKQIKINPKHHKLGLKVKYVILVVIVGSSFFSFTLAEKLSELEPFKTSITLVFVRYWPFVAYALILLLLSLKIHKFYCRYLCSLGAGLAILGRYPLFKLLRRRDECGNPCHLCRQKKCGIDAINQDGSIDYSECIQCLECVVTLDNPDLCKIDKYKKKSIATRVHTIHPVSNK